MISPRAVAVRGLGYGALLVALRGLFGVAPSNTGNRLTQQIFIFTEAPEQRIIVQPPDLWANTR